jgi:hypothetical protein
VEQVFLFLFSDQDHQYIYGVVVNLSNYCVRGLSRNLNDIFFSKGTFFVECLIDRVKLLSWKWFLSKNSGSPCSFYKWGIHHTLCWNR